MVWPETGSTPDQLATIESVFFNYPGANLTIVGSHLDRSPLIHRLPSVLAQGYCVSLHELPTTQPTDFVSVQLYVYELQVQLGGLYIPFNGALLNTLEHMTHSEDGLLAAPVFMEIVHGGSIPEGVALSRSDFEVYGNPRYFRGWNDFRENSTVVCALHCVRYIPANCSIASVWVDAMRLREPLLHPDFVLTSLIKRDLSGVVILPFWLIAEHKFPDHWNAFGSRPGYTDGHTDMYSPRPHRYRQDYWLVVHTKLWLPWSPEQNALDLSVVALVKQTFSLNLFSDPFTPLFGENSASVTNIGNVRIASPLDRVTRLMTKEQIAMNKQYGYGSEVGLSGDTGGYRTFRFLRILGDKNDGQYNVRVSILSSPGSGTVRLYCRSHTFMTECDSGLVKSNSELQLSGSLSHLNSIMDALAYTSANTSSPMEPIVELKVTIGNATDGEYITETRFSALAETPAASVTVIAHSADRCQLLQRLIMSAQQYYPGIAVIVTCECSYGELNCPVEASFDLTQSTPTVTWVKVPYDYGLSRGKSWMIGRVETEFVLVLDDDFTFSPISCIECLMLRMKSSLHSGILPLDIIGFPVLEDERAFGAFRGTLRATDTRFLLEPFVHSTSPDGCARVDICPMVFLARTSRLKQMEWNHNLPVGEHEQFFYANKLNGLQVAVCSDTAFAHSRINPAVMNLDYMSRRQRQGKLMNSALSAAGITQTFYLFHKYSHIDQRDFANLAASNINPYVVRDDSGDARDFTLGEFKPVYIAIFSNNATSRAYHRSPMSEYFGLKNQGTATVVFIVSVGGADDDVAREQSDFNDIILVPTGSGSKCKFVFELFRNMIFHYLILVDDSRSVDAKSISDTVSRPRTEMMVYLTSDGLRGFSRDLHLLISYPPFLRNLRVTNNDTILFKMLDEWVKPLSFEHVQVITHSHPSADNS